MKFFGKIALMFIFLLSLTHVHDFDHVHDNVETHQCVLCFRSAKCVSQFPVFSNFQLEQPQEINLAPQFFTLELVAFQKVYNRPDPRGPPSLLL